MRLILKKIDDDGTETVSGYEDCGFPEDNGIPEAIHLLFDLIRTDDNKAEIEALSYLHEKCFHCFLEIVERDGFASREDFLAGIIG